MEVEVVMAVSVGVRVGVGAVEAARMGGRWLGVPLPCMAVHGRIIIIPRIPTTPGTERIDVFAGQRQT